ncbi:FecCD family ABC transporter permease [Microbaculum marinisediminis]|uniref:Iron ABC transporter permease n=1 Tax=Microbaculum marinisediminis TaxID=2931392 RepID=A0AAW5R6G1_9HYPH|nr:iron ABC transporter permease [Microbaculum sp. A6E488]MCT8974263.1 iron ABC transporter permease [Microbaculum sp. A6E488]
MSSDVPIGRRHAAETATPVLPGTLCIVSAILFVLSLAIGYVPLDPLAAALDAMSGRDTVRALVMVELRLPRALLGLMVGFSLGATGAALQGLLRNPLADPGVIGVSGAAALGAVIAFYWGLAGFLSIGLALGGLAGAGVATALLLLLARQGTGTTALILAGVAIGSLSGALTALALNLSPSPYAVMEVVFWLMGSLADRSLDHVLLAMPFMAVGWVLLLGAGRGLDALSLGEDTARSLGFDVARLRVRLVLASAFTVGSAVAVAGAIGFVGLVVPHILRPLVGHRPGPLVLASGLGGAVLTLAADILVRLLPVQPELKLGVVTAIIGAPFLFSLLWRMRGDVE